MFIIAADNDAYNTDFMVELYLDRNTLHGVFHSSSEQGYADFTLYVFDSEGEAQKVYCDIFDAMEEGHKVYWLGEEDIEDG